MKKNKRERKQLTTYNTDMEATSKKALIITICILAVLVLMYFLTDRILSKSEENNNTEEIVIQYDKILAGESFNQGEDDYYVIYYDSSDEYSTLPSLVSTYQSQTDKTRLYSVDLNDGMNQKYKTDGDIVTTSASELRVKYPTLLHFVNHQVTEVITDSTQINEYLSAE